MRAERRRQAVTLGSGFDCWRQLVADLKIRGEREENANTMSALQLKITSIQSESDEKMKIKLRRDIMCGSLPYLASTPTDPSHQIIDYHPVDAKNGAVEYSRSCLLLTQ